MKLKHIFTVLIFSTVSLCADDYKDSAELIGKANEWKLGESVPAKLLKYRSSDDDSCFPNPAGTESLFCQITNYTLLKEIAFLQKLDSRVFTNAVNRALVFAGPNRFFPDVIQSLKTKPELLKLDRFKELKKQAEVKHVVVDSLYITYANMPPEKSKTVLSEIERELQSGRGWKDVYEKYRVRFEYPYEQKLGGRTFKGTSTYIGNLGDFVVPQNNSELFAYRLFMLPKSHQARLFAAKTGDILVLFDKEDLSRFPDLAKKETGERYVLYQVREIWPGAE